MVLAGKSNLLKAMGWRDRKTRTLGEAARLAQTLVAQEHLPIGATVDGNAAQWHAEAILKTVPVYGLRDGRLDRVESGPRLDPGATQTGEAHAGAWRDLQVKRADFERYLEWLRSMW